MAGKELRFGLLLSVLDRATGPLGKVQDAFARVGRAGEALQNIGADLRIARENVQDFADRGRAALEGVIQPTHDLEAALLGLRPAAQGWGDVAEVLARTQERAIDHTRDTGQAATDYIAAVTRMARAGHDEAGAHEAAALAMRLSSGASLSAADAANVLALTYDQLGDRTRGWHDEMTRIGDVLVRAREVYGSFDVNTMRDVMKDTAAAAQDAGLPLDQLIGLNAALQDAGVQGGASAAASRAILESLESASLATGLAIERTADGGLDLARTLASVQQQIDTAVDPEFMRGAFADAFGPAWAHVSLLLRDTEQLGQRWDEIGSAVGTAADAHAAATGTTAAELAKMGAEWTALKLELAAGVIPALKELAPHFKAILDPVLEFVRANPELVATVGTYSVLAVAAAQVASPVLSAASAAASFAGTSMRAVSSTGKWIAKTPEHIKAVGQFGRSVWGGVAAVEGWIASAGVAAGKAPAALMASLKGVGASALAAGKAFWAAPIPALGAAAKAAWAFGAALLANPITWVVAAVVAAAALIYLYWDPIKDFFGGLWADVKAAFEVSWVDGILKIIELFSPLAWIAKGLDAVTEYLFGFSLLEAGKNIVVTLGQGIVAMATYPIGEMRKVVGKIRNLLPFSPAKDGPLRDLHRVKLVETVAEAVRPAPLVDAMRGAAQQAMGALTDVPVPQFAPSPMATFAAGGAGFAAAAGAGAGAVNMTVTIQLGGGDRGAVAELERWLRDPGNARRLSVAIQSHQAREARAEFR